MSMFFCIHQQFSRVLAQQSILYNPFPTVTAFSDAFYLMAIARGFKTPGSGGQHCLGSLNSVNAVWVCKLQISGVTALKRMVTLIKLGLIPDTPETQKKEHYFNSTPTVFAASVNAKVNNEINLWCSIPKENVPLHFWLCCKHSLDVPVSQSTST